MRPLISELELQERFPEIPWDQPVQIHVLGKPAGRWVCRYCIAMHGLKAQAIDVTPFAYDTRLEALNHIDVAHHD